MANYTFTSFDQSLGFGKYSELSLEEVLNDNPSYISWCIDNISEFCMSPELIDEIKTRFPNLEVPAEFEERFLMQIATMKMMIMTTMVQVTGNLKVLGLDIAKKI